MARRRLSLGRLTARVPRPAQYAGRARLRSIVLALMLLAATAPGPSTATSNVVGPKQYYLVLGDSGAFGFQPDGDWRHGYSDKWFVDLQAHGVKRVVNYACMAELSNTFIQGGCPLRLVQRTPHFGDSQLAAALSFINAHPGQVSPITIDLGSVDMAITLDPVRQQCFVIQNLWDSHLATLDANLKNTILPALVAALTDANGNRTGDIILMNQFNVFQNECPNYDSYMKELNEHFAEDAAMFNVKVADVYTAFNNYPTPNPNICVWTWFCTPESSAHATGGQPGEPGDGFGVEVQVLEQTVGY